MNDSNKGSPPPRKGRESFEQLFAESTTAMGRIPMGEKVQAKVFMIGKEYVFLDLGSRYEGLLPRAAVQNDDGEVTVKEGDTLTVYTIQFRDGAVICGRSIGQTGATESTSDKEMALAAVREAFESGMPIEGTVKELVKGGYSVTVVGLRAFCPISQIADAYTEHPEEHLGHTYTFAVIELDGTGRNIVVSRRKLLEAEAEERAAQVWQTLEVGAVFEGTVTSVKTYGVFVDIGGVEGLLHVSEIDYERVDDPSTAFTKGDKVKVIIKEIEPEKKRISLSRKALLEDPWLDVAQTITEGAVLTGQVVRLARFGAFVELKRGVEGLIHISEMGQDQRIRSPRDVAKVGSTVKVRVVAVDPDQRRIALSMEGIEEAEARAEGGEGEPARNGERGEQKSLGTFGDLFGKMLKK